MRVRLIDHSHLTVMSQTSIYSELMNSSATDSVSQSCVTSPTVVVYLIRLYYLRDCLCSRRIRRALYPIPADPSAFISAKAGPNW